MIKKLLRSCIYIYIFTFTAAVQAIPPSLESLTVEDVIIKAYKQTLKKYRNNPSLLMNAPISGKTNYRGMHLLSFAAFNEFTRLADWGLARGARIDTGDKDNATMLRMAIGNYNPRMARYALMHGASPNIMMGSGKDTLVGALVKWNWPLTGFKLAKDFHAKPASEDERQDVLLHISTHFPDSEEFNDLYSYFAATPLIKESIGLAEQGELIDTNMIEVIDSHLLKSIKNSGTKQGLSEEVMADFQVRGKNFEAFLAFNGFTKSLKQRLASMPQKKAKNAVAHRDAEGNDLLIAAIKSLNVETLTTILDISSETINDITPNNTHYYSKGERPLHIAIQWEVPLPLFNLLLKSGAQPTLKNSRGFSAPALLEDHRKWGYISRDSYQDMLQSLQNRDEL